MTSRRTFLAGAATAASASRVLGANDRVRLGVIGTGGRGSHLMNVANEVGGHEWVAVCDAWDVRRDKAVQTAGAPVEKYADYRKLLERKDIDAVIVATWDNLHAQVTMDACTAAKDVFVEKPMTSLPMQGVDLVKTVRKTNRVVQVGVQQRSMKHFIEAKQRFIDTGAIGQVTIVRTFWNANGGYLEKPPAGMETKPAGLDWNACLGWLPKIAWDPKRYFNRFAYWDFSTGGQTGGLFVHMVDVVHWYLGLEKAKSAVALGGIWTYPDGRDTPDNINGIVEYPNGLNVTFEATVTDMIPKQSADIVFLGSKGRLHIFRGGYRFIPAEKGAQEIIAQGTPESDHMRNWLDCVRTRKQPNADAVSGHYSALSCHLMNIAYKESGRAKWQDAWNV
ncbi:MAG TPA: Gfo/Idh/MocA family oxidoreductase [Bryobacteraceae bacterium]|nr:Gfo/Idh/MocA family oxidoreductase [Bryobacteraceae bacterium]